MESHLLVIFGASGDLTFRKLVPALFDLYAQKLLPPNFGVLGVGRTQLADEDFKTKMRSGAEQFAHHWSTGKEDWDAFALHLHYTSMDTAAPEDYQGLKTHMEELTASEGIKSNYIFYLATPPLLYGPVATNLCAVGLSSQEAGFVRLIIEKPFGYDLATAQALNLQLLSCFEEDQIYRIDHYLGKETVQNLFVTRFSNGIFEPLWNRNFVDYIEITSSETIGVEERGGYYEGAGALRDMTQNHLLQIAAMVAMEPPSVLNSTAIRNETLKVFQAMNPIKEEEVEQYVVRGQYMDSTIRGESMKSYRMEKGVNPESRTETFLAVKFLVNNWRWAGVPFFLRTGKRMPTRVTEVVIHFKPTPHSIFQQHSMRGSSNQLVIRIQPDEGLLLKLGMKIPGAGYQVQDVNMDYHYSELTHQYVPSAYERLLLDSMIGDSTLYARGDAVLKAWELVQPILDAWKNNPSIPVYGYPSGTWGPEAAFNLIHKSGFEWRYPCKNLSNDGNYCEL